MRPALGIYAAALNVEVEIFHSNIEGEVIDRIYKAVDEGLLGQSSIPTAIPMGIQA